MNARMRFLLCLFAFVLFPDLAAQAQDGETEDLTAETEVFFDNDPERCISVRSIRSTEIVDDRTILFYMRRRDLIYRNNLDSECPGLARIGRMAYTVQGGRLCSVDTITIPDPINRRFDAGWVCRLGNFKPISPDDARRLLGELDEVADGDSNLVITEIELPRDADDRRDAEKE